MSKVRWDSKIKIKEAYRKHEVSYDPHLTWIEPRAAGDFKTFRAERNDGTCVKSSLQALPVKSGWPQIEGKLDYLAPI